MQRSLCNDANGIDRDRIHQRTVDSAVQFFDKTEVAPYRSTFSARFGSTREARRAGRYVARRATAASARTRPARLKLSTGLGRELAQVGASRAPIVLLPAPPGPTSRMSCPPLTYPRMDRCVQLRSDVAFGGAFPSEPAVAASAEAIFCCVT